MKPAVLSRSTAPIDLVDLNFENTFVREFPADPVTTMCRARCAMRVTRASTRRPSQRHGCSRSPEVARLLGIARW